MTTKQTRKKAASRHQDKVDLFQVVTDKIVAALEKGTSPWRKPWRTVAGTRSVSMSGLPANAITGVRLENGKYPTLSLFFVQTAIH